MTQRATGRAQSSAEEIANSASHGLALFAVVSGTAYLSVANSGHSRSVASVVGGAVFAVTMMLLYLTSTLYHALPAGRAKAIFLRLDLAAIYLFIAGTYTAFAMTARGGGSGWVQLGVIWSLALTGAALKVLDRLSHPVVSTGLYLVIGWVALIGVLPLAEQGPVTSVVWLVSGGIAYSVGILFFVFDSRLRFAHAVWHGFVIAGSGCHFVAVVNFVI